MYLGLAVGNLFIQSDMFFMRLNDLLPGHLDERESTTERDLVVRVRTDLKAGEWFTNGDRVIFFVGEIDNNFSSSSLFPFSSGLLPFNSTISVDAQ